jgi:lipopolysaccharide/colanic/teichoic acid biosynthesis glycosyltransferase
MTHPWNATTNGPPVAERRIGAADLTRFAPSARRRVYMGWKCCVEWIGALALLPAVAPVVALLAILLKCTSEGPVLYSQLRLGRSGRPFRMYKLRTMAHDCEAATGPVWSAAGDPRVTHVGRWLRATHLDELPQLWNVLRGEMSLIGPRPERPEIAAVIERVLPEFRARLQVRPGITGLAQIQLPADTDLNAVRHKLASDLLYVRNVGPALDARIAAATICRFVGHLFAAASRRLVRSFTPHPLDVGPADAAPDYTLSIAGRYPAPQQELSRAA